MNNFKILPLKKAMLNNLNEMNYLEMTPIQKESLPYILDGHDILAQAKTGSGKTAAFGIGVLHHLKVEKFRVQSLILCPTHELAEQVTGELRRLGRYQHNIKILKITGGGIPFYKQAHSLSHQAHIVVGTPGRILKHLKKDNLRLDDLSTLVLDEADRMLDMGFIDQIKDIISFAPKKRQTLLFSATFPDPIIDLSKKFLQNPVKVTVETQHDESVIEQQFFKVKPTQKIDLIVDQLIKHTPESTIIFSNTKDVCRRIESLLNKKGVHSIALHGDLDHKQRTEALVRFSNKSCRVLIATDVAARGIDVPDLALVINYDMPFDSETYVHRIGRTGRAGKEGLSISFVKPGEEFRLKEINELLNSSYSARPVPSGLRDDIDSQPALEPAMKTLSINAGRKNKVSAGDILGTLTADKIVAGSDIGKIDRFDYVTFIAVKREVSDDAFKVLNKRKIKGRQYLVMRH